jgi:hypothetical protein
MLSSHAAAFLHSQQGSDDSDGGVMLIVRKSKTYVAPDIVKDNGSEEGECVRSYSDECSVVDWNNGNAIQQSEECCRRKEFAVSKKVVGRI